LSAFKTAALAKTSSQLLEMRSNMKLILKGLLFIDLREERF
jgi:hypothetical protein